MLAEKQTAIEEFFDAEVTGVTKVFENMPSPAPELLDDWVRCTVLFGDSKRIEIGGGTYRYIGVVAAQIFLKEGVGVSRGVAIADIIKTALMDQVDSGVNYQVPYVTKIPFADKGWFQVQVTIPFYFDEVIP